VLAAMALLLLLLFIHHMASSIQVSTITARIARSTLATLDRVYPAPFGEPVSLGGDELVRAWLAEARPHELCVGRPGYVRSVALDELPDLIGPGGRRIHVTVAPGDFVTPAEPVARVWPGGEGEARDGRLRRAFVIADERDIVQDPGYGLRQLTDIALRALSPGVNDPTTAVTCAGYVTAILERLAGRAFPGEVREFPEQDLIVVVRRPDFSDFVESSLVEISRHAREDTRVLGVLLGALTRIARAAKQAGADERLAGLAEAGRGIARSALEAATSAAEREELELDLERLAEATSPS